MLIVVVIAAGKTIMRMPKAEEYEGIRDKKIS